MITNPLEVLKGVGEQVLHLCLEGYCVRQVLCEAPGCGAGPEGVRLFPADDSSPAPAPTPAPSADGQTAPVFPLCSPGCTRGHGTPVVPRAGPGFAVVGSDWSVPAVRPAAAD